MVTYKKMIFLNDPMFYLKANNKRHKEKRIII